MKPKYLQLVTLGLTLAATPLQAGDAIIPVEPIIPTDSDSWEFTLSPYAWAAGINGTTGIGNVYSEVDVPFSDILDSLEMTLMLQFEARKGRWAFLFDGLWIKLGADADTPGPRYGGAELTLEEIRLAGMLAYRVLEGETSLDLFAGVSYFSLDLDIELQPGKRSGKTVRASADWVDPLVGFNLRHELSERWFTVLRGEIGGFGVGSDLTWQVLGGFGYRTGESSSLFLGYRHLDIDYQDSSFTFDAETAGLILGMSFSF